MPFSKAIGGLLLAAGVAAFCCAEPSEHAPVHAVPQLQLSDLEGGILAGPSQAVLRSAMTTVGLVRVTGIPGLADAKVGTVCHRDKGTSPVLSSTRWGFATHAPVCSTP